MGSGAQSYGGAGQQTFKLPDPLRGKGSERWRLAWLFRRGVEERASPASAALLSLLVLCAHEARRLLGSGSVIELRHWETGVAMRLFAGSLREESRGDKGVTESGSNFGMVRLSDGTYSKRRTLTTNAAQGG